MHATCGCSRKVRIIWASRSAAGSGCGRKTDRTVACPYLLYDVFTQDLLTGNPLAVFPDARAVAAASMQGIARELNLSETTFVLPAEREDTDVRMRIFTPAVE